MKRKPIQAMSARSDHQTHDGSSSWMPRASSATRASSQAASITGVAVAHVMKNEQTQPRMSLFL